MDAVRESALAGQRLDQALDDRVGLRAHFVVGRVLDRMRNEDAAHVGQSERARLRLGRIDERRGRHHHRGLAVYLKPYRVVHTARCTRPSIGQSLDNRVNGPKLFYDSGWGRLRKRRLRRADNVGYVKSLAEQLLQSIEEEVAAGLADIQQTDGLAL